MVNKKGNMGITILIIILGLTLVFGLSKIPYVGTLFDGVFGILITIVVISIMTVGLFTSGAVTSQNVLPMFFIYAVIIYGFMFFNFGTIMGSIMQSQTFVTTSVDIEDTSLVNVLGSIKPDVLSPGTYRSVKVSIENKDPDLPYVAGNGIALIALVDACKDDPTIEPCKWKEGEKIKVGGWINDITQQIQQVFNKQNVGISPVPPNESIKNVPYVWIEIEEPIVLWNYDGCMRNAEDTSICSSYGTKYDFGTIGYLYAKSTTNLTKEIEIEGKVKKGSIHDLSIIIAKKTSSNRCSEITSPLLIGSRYICATFSGVSEKLFGKTYIISDIQSRNVYIQDVDTAIFIIFGGILIGAALVFTYRKQILAKVIGKVV